MNELGFNQTTENVLCDYTEAHYKDLTLANCGNWWSAFFEAVIIMSDSGAKVHRAGGQERKMDTEWGRENKLRTTSTTCSP